MIRIISGFSMTGLWVLGLILLVHEDRAVQRHALWAAGYLGVTLAFIWTSSGAVIWWEAFKRGWRRRSDWKGDPLEDE